MQEKYLPGFSLLFSLLGGQNLRLKLRIFDHSANQLGLRNFLAYYLANFMGLLGASCQQIILVQKNLVRMISSDSSRNFYQTLFIIFLVSTWSKFTYKFLFFIATMLHLVIVTVLTFFIFDIRSEGISYVGLRGLPGLWHSMAWQLLLTN